MRLSRQRGARAERPPTTRRRAPAFALGFVLTLVVVGGVVWWFAPYGEVAEEGARVPLTVGVGELGDDLAVEHEVAVLLPDGTLDLRIGETTDELAADTATEGRSGETLKAPRGYTFLPYEWGVVGSDVGALSRNLGTSVGLDDRQPGTTFEVRVGETQPVPIATSSGGVDTLVPGPAEALVVADDDLDDVVFEVTYDDLTQRVDAGDGSVDAAAAEFLYEQDPDQPARATFPTEPRLCMTEVRPDVVRSRVDCEGAGPYRTPWLPELGWVSEPGRVWTLVRVEMALPGRPDVDPPKDGVLDYSKLTLDSRRYRLEGIEPAHVSARPPGTDDPEVPIVAGAAVFDSEPMARMLEVRQGFDLVFGYDADPDPVAIDIERVKKNGTVRAVTDLG